MRPREILHRSEEWLSKKTSEVQAKSQAEKIKKRSTTRYRLAKSYYNKRMYAEAIAELEEVIRTNPDYMAAYYYLALAYEASELYQEALREWESYLGRDPHSRWALDARERYESLKNKLSEEPRR